MIASRSPVVRLGIQTASPLALVVGLYLLFAGHNNPGGGFAAGLVFGAVVTLRVLSGLQRPTFGVELIAGGTLVVALVVAMPLVWGDTLLDQQVISFDLPILGTVKSGSALDRSGCSCRRRRSRRWPDVGGPLAVLLSPIRGVCGRGRFGASRNSGCRPPVDILHD